MKVLILLVMLNDAGLLIFGHLLHYLGKFLNVSARAIQGATAVKVSSPDGCLG